jgi:hypothetical protein
VPLTLRIGRKRERQQDQRDSCSKQEQAEEIQIEPQVLKDLRNGTSTERAAQIVAELFRTSLVHEKADEQRDEASWQDDRPDPVSPSPRDSVKNIRADLRSSPDSPEERNIEERGVQCTI